MANVRGVIDTRFASEATSINLPDSLVSTATLERPSMKTTRCFPGRVQFTSADYNFLLHRLRCTGTQLREASWIDRIT